MANEVENNDRASKEYRDDRRLILKQIERLDSERQKTWDAIDELRRNKLDVLDYRHDHEKLEERVRIVEGKVIRLLVQAGLTGGASGLGGWIVYLTIKTLRI